MYVRLQVCGSTGKKVGKETQAKKKSVKNEHLVKILQAGKVDRRKSQGRNAAPRNNREKQPPAGIDTLFF